MNVDAEFDAFVIDDFGPSVRVQVPSTAEGLARFNQAFLDPQERAYVQHIDFHIVLPTISYKHIKKLQSSKEAAENDAIFTRAIVTFLGRLAKWERRRYGPGVNLKIAVESPTDRLVEEMEEHGELRNTHNHRVAPIWQVRDHFSYLRFDSSLLSPSDSGPAKLPQVPCVSEFEFDGGPGGRNFHPDAISAISSTLLSARKMEWSFRLPTRRLTRARKQIRSSLGNALLNTSFPSLIEFRIKVDDKDPMDETYIVESLMGEDEEQDTLSLGYLYVDCSITTPDGKYLLTGDQSKALADDGGYGLEHDEKIAAFDSDDSDISDFQPDFEWSRQAGEFPGRWFRYTPEPEIFVALATSFVGAVDRMPSLRRMDIHFGG
ncbi:hypothetical protein CSPX01_11226 [Colletotrichum filicis]|nr:hypothetical protein CSPX01_11226 [Colletotrichum filicis]